MWQVRRTPLSPDTEHLRLLADGGDARSFAQVMGEWHESRSFRANWREVLSSIPFDAYCWECPPITVQMLSRAFECVFVSSPLLARMRPDPEQFAEYFSPGCSVVAFDSLGKDARLIAPCRGTPGNNFAHLGSFVATAPPAQQDALWKTVGRELAQRIGASPTWLSTAGLGVAWLHVRLDSRPKYYRHAAYAKA